MTNQHPITPPPELVDQWYNECHKQSEPFTLYMTTKAARWGSDQELEACCEWLERNYNYPQVNHPLRAARRPKPPSLKKQALEALREAESSGCLYVNNRSDTIRKALEALSND